MKNPRNSFVGIKDANVQYTSYLARILQYKENKRKVPLKYRVALKYWAVKRWWMILVNIVHIVQIHDITINQHSEHLQFLTVNSNRKMKRKWERMLHQHDFHLGNTQAPARRGEEEIRNAVNGTASTATKTTETARFCPYCKKSLLPKAASHWVSASSGTPGYWICKKEN